MAEPVELRCTRQLALEWPRLMRAAGFAVAVDASGLSGTIDQQGQQIQVRFQQYGLDLLPRYNNPEVVGGLMEQLRGLCSCRLSDIPDEVAGPLAKSMLASGARCSYAPMAVAKLAALIRFERQGSVEVWNDALTGVAELVVQGVVRHPDGPPLPYGIVRGNASATRFSTGPGCNVADATIRPYLEIHVDRLWDWGNIGCERWLDQVISCLQRDGGAAVALWGELLPCALIDRQRKGG